MKVKILKKLIKISLITIFILPLYSETINLIDIPTAWTILRGYYDVNVIIYGGGGLSAKISIGLTDRLMLGISEDIGGAIGSQKADWNIPGVLAKLNLIYPSDDSLGIAIGYDSFLNGEYGKCYNNKITEDIVYGIYLAFTKPVSLFRGSQFWHFGVRFPLLPFEARKNGKNISLYTGLNIIINREIMIMGEVENIYLNGNRNKEILYNCGIKYNFSEALSVRLNFQYTSSREINPEDKATRSILLEYQNIFY
jgi:hypothetical protein